MENKQLVTVWKLGNNINTDLLYPSKYLYESQEPTVLASHVLEPIYPDFQHMITPGDYVVAGENFGCGSSREQAVTALKYAGCGGIIAKSYSRIFFRNCIAHGIAAIVCPEAVDAVEEGDRICVDGEAGKIYVGEQTYIFSGFGEYVGSILKCGGLIPFLHKRMKNC